MEESQAAGIDGFQTQLSTNNSSPLVGKLKKLLYKRMLIGVNDGRYFLGLFHCIDKQGNIILQEQWSIESHQDTCQAWQIRDASGLFSYQLHVGLHAMLIA